MSATAIESARVHALGLRDDAARRFDQLAQSVADESEVDPAEVLEICEAAGRSLEDLQAAADAISDLRRLENLATIEEFQAARADLRGVQQVEAAALAAFQEAREAWKIAQQAFERSTDSTAPQRSEVERRLSVISSARAEICRRTGRQFELAPADGKRSELTNELRDVRSSRAANWRNLPQLMVLSAEASSNEKRAARIGQSAALAFHRDERERRELQLSIAVATEEELAARELQLSDRLLILAASMGR